MAVAMDSWRQIIAQATDELRVSQHEQCRDGTED
jgi:hypothetical protein